MNKKILAISNYGSMVGGGEHSFFDLITHIHPGWEAVVLTPGAGDLTDKIKKRGIETRIIFLSSIRPWHITGMVKSLKEYFQLCIKHRFSLIYANGSRAAFYGGIVGNILNIPVIWHCRIAESDPYLDLILACLTTKIITNSEATAGRFKKRYRSKITVVYNGLDLGWLQDRDVRKAEQTEEEWKVILVVSRVSKNKRHDVVLLSFEAAAKSNPNAHLVCVGAPDPLEPDWWRFLQELTQKSPYSSRIHWIGESDDVRPWYLTAHLLVSASEAEGFGRVIVEAMACGVPVIATESGAVPEIVRHGREGYLVPAGKVPEMTSAIEILFNNGKVRERMSRAARKRAEFFNLDNHVAKMVKVFDETVHKQ